jgi:carbon-monoxide dehydrogenase medium subunit
MYPSNFEYVRANSVQEAVALLQEREDAKLLAGGHSLIPLMKLRTAMVGTLVDIGRIPELKGVHRPNGTAAIGSLTTHAMVAASADLPIALREAAGNIGDRQVRNRGTIGGNAAHADPASDLPTVLTALGATFFTTGPSGQRFTACESFFNGFFTCSLGPHDVLTAIEVPIHEKGTGSAYAKMVSPASGYAILGAAAMVTIKDGKCTAASVAVGGLTPQATKAPSVEAALVGQTLDEASITAAARAIEDDLGDDLLGDFYTSAEYRKAMAPVYVQRALKIAAERAMQ